jgi:hypothetical protein
MPTIKHAYTVVASDDPAYEVSASEFNADLDFTFPSTNLLVGRFTTGAGAAEDVTLGGGVTFVGGALTIDHDLIDNYVAAEHVDWASAGAGTIHTDNYIEGGDGTDGTAIHDNVAGEITAITPKAVPDLADEILIEDSEAADVKKAMTVAALMSPSLQTGLSTGLVTGGILSIGTPNTTFSISDGNGFVIDNTTVPGTPTITEVSWSGETNLTITNLATNLITFVSINSAGTVIQRTSRWTPDIARDEILLGVVVHVDKTIVDAVNQEQHVSLSTGAAIGDILDAFGFVNIEGNVFGPSGADLTIDKTVGKILASGANWDNDPKNPHHLELPLLTNATFQYRFLDGTNGATGTNIDPDIYDVGGTSTPVPANKWTIQRIYSFTSNNVKIQPGQTLYNSLSLAKEGLATDAFTTEPSIAANGLLRGFLIVKEGTTDLTDANTLFLSSGKLGEVASTASGGGSDGDAIHDNVASEISAITEKVSPVGADLLVIEDSAAGNAKKRVQITNLPGGADADAIHDNVASEISVLTEKVSPVGGDHILIEDSAAGNVKKRVQITNLPGGADADAIHDNVASEISAITAKATPVAGDFFVIEDSAAANVKKSATFAAIEGAISHANITGVVANEHLDWTASVGTIHTDNYIQGGAGTDTTAIHDDTASEISALTEKVSPVGADHILIEDSAAGNVKKRVQITNLPGGADADAIHDNVASEISVVTNKPVLTGADFFLIEDSAAANVKKHSTFANIEASLDLASIPGTLDVEQLGRVTADPNTTTGATDYLGLFDTVNAVSTAGFEWLRFSSQGTKKGSIGWGAGNAFVFSSNGGRMDFNSGAGQMFFTSASTFFQSNTSINRAGDAVSTVTQADSYGLLFQSSMWTGAAEAKRYSSLHINASITVDEESFTELWVNGITAAKGVGTQVWSAKSNGFFGVGSTDPLAMFTVGADKFRVDSTGDITRINDIAYTWPAAHATGLLKNSDGAGTITFATLVTADVGDNQITYAKMQDVSATARLLGRITAGAGDAEELTGTQATTLLDAFTSGLPGLAPASGGGTTNFLRADGTWTAPPGGTDADAIHDNVASEISAITAKATPVAGDFFVIEDSAAANVKKSATFSAIEAAISHANITGVVANEHLDWTASVGTIHTDNYIQGGAGTDTTGLHDDTASEISAITNKAVPVAGDFFVIEDSAAGNAKKHSTFANIESALSILNLSGTLSIAKGGTGQTTQAAAFDALAPTTTKGDIIVYGASDNVRIPVGTNGQRLVADSTDAEGIVWADEELTLNFIIDGGGSAITTGVQGDLHIDFDCEITQVTMLADQSGSIVVDIWKDSYANFPATDADSITASAVPTITTAVKSQDATLTGWTKTITAGDHLRFNVDSITTCQRVTVAIRVKRTG